LIDTLVFLGGTAYTALINEYDTSIGPNGCNSRRAYVTGRAVGDVVAFLLPAEKLTAMMKVKAIRYAEESVLGIKAGRFVGKWLEYRKDVLSVIAGMPNSWKSRFFRTGDTFGIHHVLLGEFDNLGRFKGKGLHSAQTLKSGMENGILEVWSKDELIKYTKYSDIPVLSNGVREVTVSAINPKGKLYKTYKSFFPEEWSDNDVVEGLLEAANVGDGKVVSITKHGKTINVIANFQPGTSLIESGYPFIPPQ